MTTENVESSGSGPGDGVYERFRQVSSKWGHKGGRYFRFEEGKKNNAGPYDSVTVKSHPPQRVDRFNIPRTRVEPTVEE